MLLSFRRELQIFEWRSPLQYIYHLCSLACHFHSLLSAPKLLGGFFESFCPVGLLLRWHVWITIYFTPRLLSSSNHLLKTKIYLWKTKTRNTNIYLCDIVIHNWSLFVSNYKKTFITFLIIEIFYFLNIKKVKNIFLNYYQAHYKS